MKKQCFITKTNERTGKISKFWRIYETKKEARRCKKEMKEEQKELKAEFPEWFEGNLAEDTYKYEVHELEKDHELYERLEEECQRKLRIIKSFALHVHVGHKIAAYLVKTAIQKAAEGRNVQQANA